MNDIKGLTDEQYQVFKSLVEKIMETSNATTLEIEKDADKIIVYAIEREEVADYSL